MNALVSVIVASYNSSSFIIETLESIAQQTWKNVELIVTDDCSVDNTVDVCRAWIDYNSSRFVRAEIITTDRNTGVSANANRGLNIAKGEWIKFLGADDTLKVDCIKNNIDWISSHPEIEVLFSRIEIYMNTFDAENLIETTPGIPYSKDGILSEDRSASSQYKMLLRNDRIHFSPSVFIKSDTFKSVGGFDERFKMLEDYPLWLNLTKNGVKLHFMEGITVNYRRHAGAINNTGISFLINPNYYRSEKFRRIYIYPNLPWDLRLNDKVYWIYCQFFRFNKFNKRNDFSIFLLSFFNYLNPFSYVIWIRKKIFGKLKTDELYM